MLNAWLERLTHWERKFVEKVNVFFFRITNLSSLCLEAGTERITSKNLPCGMEIFMIRNQISRTHWKFHFFIIKNLILRAESCLKFKNLGLFYSAMVICDFLFFQMSSNGKCITYAYTFLLIRFSISVGMQNGRVIDFLFLCSDSRIYIRRINTKVQAHVCPYAARLLRDWFQCAIRIENSPVSLRALSSSFSKKKSRARGKIFKWNMQKKERRANFSITNFSLFSVNRLYYFYVNVNYELVGVILFKDMQHWHSFEPKSPE